MMTPTDLLTLLHWVLTAMIMADITITKKNQSLHETTQAMLTVLTDMQAKELRMYAALIKFLGIDDEGNAYRRPPKGPLE